MRLFKIFIPPFLIIGYLILVSYPYIFSKINRFDSLGPLSLVEEKSINLQKTLNPQRTTDQLDDHLLKGEKITAQFKASENNLGIMLIRFAQLSAKVSDVVIFRIKEAAEEKWYYENKYRADQFQPDQYFTFGFPPISDSKDKVYVFEVESQAGTYKNGIGLSSKKPQVALVYKYTREDLKNFNTLSSFISKKLVYVAGNVNFLENWLLLSTFVVPLLIVLLMQKKKTTMPDIVRFFPKFKKNPQKNFKVIVRGIKFNYLSLEKKIINFSKKINRSFTSTRFYLLFLNTNTKKRLATGLLIFLLAFLYRFSATLVDIEGVSTFYSGLGGGGDYDQFIRAATCALSFCSAILGQNMPIEAPLLGTFFKIFGFTGGLGAYLYFMLILSSIVATLPYIILSRKNFLTIGGIIGSLFLATSDYLTKVALNFPPDNGSSFTFSIFFIVYLVTINKKTIRWLLLFGFTGFFDGMFKALLLLNVLVSLALFAPVFFYEKAINKTISIRKQMASIFVKKNLKVLFLSLIPLAVFLTLYTAWETLAYVRFSAPYFLRGLVETSGSSFVSYTSFNESLSGGNILEKLYYYAGSFVVLQKRIIQHAGLSVVLLTPIFIGLLFFTFRKPKSFLVKLVSIMIFVGISSAMLELFKSNYLGIQEIGQYVYAWPKITYINVFLFTGIIFLFILNLKYSAIRLLIPILPYYIILVILAKNSPWERLWIHVIVWSIILLSFLTDLILDSINKYLKTRISILLGAFLLVLFVLMHTLPKITTIASQLNLGLSTTRSEVAYLKWVDSELPENAVILAGGKSDLVTVAGNIKRPIIYNTLWTGALLIKPNEIPGVKASDFAILQDLKRTELPGITPSDFNIIKELKNKNNFRKNKYILLEDDIFIWRDRISGVVDSIFSTSSASLHADDYSIKVYKFNPTLKKAIYELNIRDKSINYE